MSSKDKLFTTELQVRGYELDGYGHVNNAVYLNYAEYARWCMIEQATGSQDYFKKNNCAPVLARVEVDYKAPLYLGDRFTIETTVLENRRRVVVFQHLMRKAEKSIAVVRATIVVVNESGKAISLPRDFVEYFGGTWSGEDS